MVVNTYIRIDSAQATSFFPSIGQGGHREFSPEKALSRGSGYWCSEGNHGKQDVVSWTGRIKTRRLVEGIEINWAYAPGKAQFHQVLTFPHAVYLKAIRIMMKDPQSQYFGISLVQLLGGGFPVLRIQSGITSPHQTSVRFGSLPNKDNNVQDGGQVVTGDCTAEYNFQDGRSTGSKAGSTDVAKDAEVRSTHSRAADDEHGPSAAVDGNADTFWASPEFPKDAVPEFVHFDVDLGDKYKLRTTDIDWEFPPLSYTIALSNDGANYVDVSRTDVNAAYTTMDDMKAVIARFLRVRMERAHPILGVSNDKLVYGIKTLSVYSNRLRSIVEPCSKAKASSDARDKFFLELVSEVDLSAGMELQRAGKAANALSMSMAKSLSAVDEIMQPAKTCLGAKKAETIKLATIETEIADTMSAIARFGLLSRGGDVAIRIVAAPHEFEGSEKNGVVSSSLLGVQRERAFTLESAARQCPTEKSPSTSFLELHASPLEAAAPTSAAPQHLPNSPTAAPNTTGTNIGIASSALPTAGPSAAAAAPTTAQSGPSPPHPPGASEELNEATTLAVNQLSTILSQQLGGFDSEVMDHVRLSATKALQKRAEQSAADEWNIDIVKNAEKSDVFHTFESKLAVGKRENHHSLCQLSAVSPTIPGSTGTGTYAILKDKNYYDFVLSGDILVSGSGSVGIAFRQANGGTKRLLRVVNGVPTEAARIDDGGFVEGQWYHVEIIAQLQRIQIRVSEVSEEASVEAPETDIDLLDGSFMSGSVGFYTSTHVICATPLLQIFDSSWDV
ncbi:F5 F8 type C domain-containing protein [Cyclospora cayetanensis]|uniref:F5 F8 type C domain-containing protein n=1 Tax=Cyclospora cayetanensis TaxID=88456 RepID=A0A1D3CU97_9EIME|nr:F5 F8 type C domain-containing protein [Cyclospora cayetanensis]